jgi:sensor histidine kinase regulating citrate/malate metabolism
MRRLFWVALGLGFGAAGAIMTSRWTRRQMQRAKPQTIAREARGGLLDLSKLVAESVEEGKRAADERERELRAKHEIPGPAAH